MSTVEKNDFFYLEGSIKYVYFLFYFVNFEKNFRELLTFLVFINK